MLEEVARGPINDNDAPNSYIRVALLPAGEALGKGFMGARFGDGPFQLMNAERIGVARRVQGH